MIALLLLACGSTPTTDIEALQLESGSFATPACADPGVCVGDVVAEGALVVTTSGVNQAFTVGETSFTLHSPGSSDLAATAGASVQATVAWDWMLPASLKLTDEFGALYVFEGGVGDAFGEFDVSFGAELGSMVDDQDYRRTFTTLVVATDDGPVELTPGDARGVTVNGVAWQFTAIAAYGISTIPGGEYTDCGGETSILSYEAVRVPVLPEPRQLTRPDGLEMASYSGCG